MHDAVGSVLERLIDDKQREVLQHKREIKCRRRKLHQAAAELSDYKRQLAEVGIQLIGGGEIHGRK